jgi:hypothetical protein
MLLAGGNETQVRQTFSLLSIDNRKASILLTLHVEKSKISEIASHNIKKL